MFTFKIWIISIVVIVLLNSIILDVLVFKNLFAPLRSSQPSAQSISAQQYTISAPGSGNDANMCPNSCINEIKNATSSMSLKPQPSIITQQVNQQVYTVTSSVKELFIPLGGGTNSTDDWADLAGIQAYVDTRNYGKIKTVVFEAALRIPTGNEVAYARLYNVTDKHPVWNSEVSLEGGTPKLVVSSLFTLDEGNKLYQVQMKTSLKFQAILDQARIHITLN